MKAFINFGTCPYAAFILLEQKNKKTVAATGGQLLSSYDTWLSLFLESVAAVSNAPIFLYISFL